MNYSLLYNLRQAHAELDDAGFLVWMATSQTRSGDEVSRKDFNYYLYQSGLYARIVAAQASGNPQIAGLAVTALGYLANPDFTIVKISDPIMQSMLGGFIAGGVFTQADVNAAMVALGMRVTLTQWQIAGLEALPTAADLSQAAVVREADALMQTLNTRYQAAVAVLNPLMARAQAGEVVVLPTVDALLDGGQG